MDELPKTRPGWLPTRQMYAHINVKRVTWRRERRWGIPGQRGRAWADYKIPF
jgi:hypothetical protein